ncbi:hypothetical protein [Pseudomonas sp. TWP3-2]|uniref:hypothetical protein n=1 Tax=Pseudomonas sp. TWP3-2 TaxID=2804574 RepID=UPI003CE8F8F8
MHRLKAAALGGILLCLPMFMEQAQANPDCTIRLGPATIDFGSTTRGQLLAQSTSANVLSFGLRRAQVTVQCERPGPLRMELVGPAADAAQYRFGAGTLRVRVLALRMDGKPVQWLSEGEGLDSDVLRPGSRLTPALAGTAIEGQSLEVELELEARIPTVASRVSDLTRFEADLGFRLR